MRTSLSVLLAVTVAPPAAAQLVERAVVPSAIDQGVHRFDDPSIIVTHKNAPADAPLVVFMTGTGGRPAGTRAIMEVVARQGYRVIGLEYDDDPAVSQVCPRDPDPGCSAAFREMRLTGTGKGVSGIANPPAEAIVPRLVALVTALDKAAPAEGWGGYLDGGQPRWDRIVVAGLSQGAGMAAFIAQQHAVRRVVLFSSPWDVTGPDHRPAPWLYHDSVTPMARWYAEYNAREKTAPLIRAAYTALRIPADHIRVFSLDLPEGFSQTGANPYHAITIRDPRYANQWRAMFGSAADPAR